MAFVDNSLGPLDFCIAERTGKLQRISQNWRVSGGTSFGFHTISSWCCQELVEAPPLFTRSIWTGMKNPSIQQPLPLIFMIAAQLDELWRPASIAACMSHFALPRWRPSGTCFRLLTPGSSA